MEVNLQVRVGGGGGVISEETGMLHVHWRGGGREGENVWFYQPS